MSTRTARTAAGRSPWSFSTPAVGLIVGPLLLTAGTAVLGALLTLVLPEPSGRSLEELSADAGVIAAAERVIRDAGEPTAAR